MSAPAVPPAVPEAASGGALPLRHLTVVLGLLLQFGGATLLIELFSRVGDPADCGYRASGACEAGTAILALGAPAFLAGVLVLGLLDHRPGWSGPAMLFGGFSLIYGSAGAGAAFAWSAFTADSVPLSVLTGLVALLPLWAAAFLVKGFLKGILRNGVGPWAREAFWILEELPRSKRRRRKMLRARGLGAARGHNGRLVPETPREKAQWALFVGESCVALAGGVLAGWLCIVHLA
ncbi:hypothetical protein [Streptomyces nitrosporeus]|uniref:hypothetical protein n=1 Tax=Streptomyces nitrosporeus TaxID=28894 RepID=UPI003324DA3C